MGKSLHLVLGDGVVGRAVADELARLGLPNTLASRTPPSSATGHAASAHRCVDALDAAALRAATAEASHVYVTLGLAYDSAVWERDWPRVVENLLAAAREHRFALVFFDNVYPYGPAPLRVPMREDHPQDPPSRKGRVRKAIDDRLMAAARDEGLRVLLARSADFYGPEVRNSVLFHSAIERQLRGKPAQWLGDPDRLHSFTYTPDAARGMVRLALDDGAYGQAWHLPTASPAPTPRQLLEASAQLLGAPMGVRPMPALLLAVLRRLVPILREVADVGYQNASDYVFSSAKFMERYPDFVVTPYAVGIRAMVDSLRAASPRNHH
ncbi:MAG: NAD-dependent epimerase/dehydratase family protein [Silanimonas sp.]